MGYMVFDPATGRLEGGLIDKRDVLMVCARGAVLWYGNCIRGEMGQTLTVSGRFV